MPRAETSLENRMALLASRNSADALVRCGCDLREWIS